MAKEEEIIESNAQRVFDLMSKRVGAEDLQRIRAAYALAREAHSGQRRQSGESYISHPVSVALIAAEELELDANTVIAAFLHDVVEDTPYTVEDIRSRFGDDVAFLVDVVTKRKKQNYASSKQVDNYKQILDSVHYDVRALLVKLSDRLHNMRTLSSMRPDKQMKIAGETDFFYAPLAGKLGLYHVKSDLENLSFRYRCPREFETISSLLQQDREQTAPAVADFCAKIDSLLASRGIKARTQVRYRQPYSIWRNMREEGCDFAHVEYKHYIRVIYTPGDGWGEKDTSLYIYSTLSSFFKERPGSVVNYIDNPKENGYQSFHVKFLNAAGIWEELHISSERMVRNSQLGCVVERGESWMERFRSVLKDIAQSSDGLYFMDGVSSSFYNEDIIAFTPKGKGVILPKGATALDFAYEVHSSIGDHAQYARINGKLSSIKTRLHRGDCVEIGVSPEISPRPEWLDFASSYKAKRHLHACLKDYPQPKYTRCEVCHPLPGDEVIGFRDSDGSITVHARHCPEAVREASDSGDSIVSVKFEEDPLVKYPVCIKIMAVDRTHLMQDILDCICGKLGATSLDFLSADSQDQIVSCTLKFPISGAGHLQKVLSALRAVDGVDEVNVEEM